MDEQTKFVQTINICDESYTVFCNRRFNNYVKYFYTSLVRHCSEQGGWEDSLKSVSRIEPGHQPPV